MATVQWGSTTWSRIACTKSGVFMSRKQKWWGNYRQYWRYITLILEFVNVSRQQMTLEGSSSGAICTSEAAYHIQQQLNDHKKSTQECGLEIERTRQMQDTHSLNFYRHHQMSGELSCVMMWGICDRPFDARKHNGCLSRPCHYSGH